MLCNIWTQNRNIDKTGLLTSWRECGAEAEAAWVGRSERQLGGGGGGEGEGEILGELMVCEGEGEILGELMVCEGSSWLVRGSSWHV